MRHQMRQKIVAVAILFAAAWTTGCRIDSDKHGDSENVKIATPFGGMQVKTNDTDVLAGIGLPAYPGATLVKKENKDGKNNDGAADINMSFGSFQLKVKAVSYRTPDRPEKVLAFYRKAMSRFGDVIQCDGKIPVGTPTRTSEGLTCEDDDNNVGGKVHVNSNDDADNTKYQLKAGSKKHQHIIAVDPEGPGTKFGLVSLDLPLDFHFGDKDDNKQQPQ